MIEPRTVVLVLILIFATVVLAIIANTIIGMLKPTFDDINQSLSSTINNRFDYDQKSQMFINFAYIALGIIVLIPFLWFIFRAIKKEPEPQQYYYGGYHVRI